MIAYCFDFKRGQVVMRRLDGSMHKLQLDMGVCGGAQELVLAETTSIEAAARHLL